MTEALPGVEKPDMITLSKMPSGARFVLMTPPLVAASVTFDPRLLGDA